MLKFAIIALVCLIHVLATSGKTLSAGHCNNNIDTIIKTIFRKAKEVTVTLSSDDLITLATAKTGRSERIVYFSAYLTKHLRNMKAGEVLVFEHVIVNKRGGYNPKNGQFVCPVSGDYWFSLDYLTLGRHTVWLDIRVNGKIFIDARGEPKGAHISVTRNVLLPLKKGDIITVTNHSHGGEFYGTSKYTGISGYLL